MNKNNIELKWQFPANDTVANLVCYGSTEPLTKQGYCIVFPNEDSFYSPADIESATVLHKKIAVQLLKIAQGDLLIIDKVAFEEKFIRIFSRGMNWNPTLMRQVQEQLQGIPNYSFSFTA